MGDFTFWISLLPSPKFGLSPKLNQKVKSILSFRLSPNFGLSERLSESFSPKFGLTPKLI